MFLSSRTCRSLHFTLPLVGLRIDLSVARHDAPPFETLQDAARSFRAALKANDFPYVAEVTIVKADGRPCVSDEEGVYLDGPYLELVA